MSNKEKKRGGGRGGGGSTKQTFRLCQRDFLTQRSFHESLKDLVSRREGGIILGLRKISKIKTTR